MHSVSDSPPRAPPVKYNAPLGTRWAKEKAAAGGATAFDLPTDPKAIGPWILGECIGKGASGRVKIAKHRRTGQLAAVKILPVAPLVNSRASLATQQAKSEKQRLGIDREITMMKLMNHPNIMRIYDVYEGDKELFLVLEYVEGGELFDFLVNKGRLPPSEALIYFRQIIYGLNYAHTFSIIHRDLKPENILIASLSPPQIKIADWGMAAFAPPTLQLETSCGSPHYASPEIVNGEKYQGNATDIWSCGVILYALLTGRLPFDDKNVRTLLTKVKSGKYDMPAWIDPLAKDLLSKMLIVDVKQRITIPEILSHPWLISHPAIPFSASDGSKFTVLPPPLPPSPSILARPIASLDLIDSELFSSLRIIWGRHADPQGESIKRDLCGPAGQGVHAKAFYFLLGKYREESSKNRSNDAEFDLQRKSSIDLETAKFNLGWELDHSGGPGGLRKYDVSKTHHVFSSPQKVSTLSALPAAAQQPYPNISIGPPPGMSSRKRTFTDGSLPAKDRSETGSRSTANGSRTQVENWKAQFLAQKDNPSGTTASSSASSTSTANSHMRRKPSVSSQTTIAVGAAPAGVSLLGRSGGRAVAPRRGQTYSLMPERRESSQPASAATTVGSMGFSQHLQQIQARAASVSSSSRSSQSHSRSQRPKSSIGPLSPFTESEKRAMFASPVLDVFTSTKTNASSDASVDAAGRPESGAQPDGASVGASVDLAEVDLPLLTAPKTDNPELQRTMEDITQRVNELVQAVAGSQHAVTASAPSPLAAGAGTKDGARALAVHSHGHGHGASSHSHPHAKVDEDKENQSIDEESWSHVNVSGDADRSGGVGLGVGLAGHNHNHGHRDVGREIGNVSQNVSSSPSRAKKEKEKKGRPPPLDLPSLNLKRTTFAMLGSPIALSTPLHPPPSSANRVMASPVVGEFKGWFSNLFGWKNSSANGGILYSSDDIHRTHLHVARILEGLGIVLANHPSEAHPTSEQTQSEILFCRVDQPTVDPASGISLKNVRFRVEFRAGHSASPDPQPSVHPMGGSGEDPSYLLTAPPQTPNYAMTPTSAGPGVTGSSRPRGSMLLGRSVSHGTPLPSPMPAMAKWDFPPGCLCAVALVHEKGSMSTFRAVWRRLKDEYGDSSTAYPCFSPAIPGTPYTESQRMVV